MKIEELRICTKQVPKSTRDMFNLAIKMYPKNHKGEHPICPVCGKEILGKHDIGHIVSRFNGGKTNLKNLVAVHHGAPCNFAVQNIDMSEVDKTKIIMFV